MWKIGNVDIKNKVVLAPMAGLSNPAYMRICEEEGIGYAITELISAEAIVRDNKKTFDMLKGYEKLNIPVALQLFGSNPETMAKAAQKIIKSVPFKIIDINMGCPVPKIASKSASGSALLKDSKKVYSIVSEVVKKIDVPVTVKIRSGWDSNSINAVEIAKTCEKAGASAITIHPRTKAQGYSGKADWNIIKKVKESVKIPVIGNGDISSHLDAKKMLEETNCDAVMIGRAAIGNPWIFKQISEYLKDGTITDKPTNNERIAMIKKHLDYILEDKPEKLAILEIRMPISKYLKGIPKNGEIKEKIFQAKSVEEIKKILDEKYD